MEYHVTVTDGNGLVLDSTIVQVGKGRTIFDWLNDHELIDPDNTITIEVKEN